MSDAVTIKIKRRASSGAAGSPNSLKSGELAFNENASDKKLYYGYGDDGSGNATSVISIAGEAIPNSGLANSSVTINGNSLALGGTLTLDTDDIGEGSTNLYYTNARARAAVSVTNDGGDGSLAYNSTTGIIVYTGPSAAETRAHFSATGGVSYNSSTGAFTLANVANSELANSSITLNGTSVSLGGSATIDASLDVSDGSTTSTIPGGGTLTVQGTTNEVEVSNSSGTLTVGLPSSVQISDNLTVGGGLTVNGTVTTVNSTTVTVDDKNIELGSVATPTDATADGGGLTLKGSTDKTIIWVDATDCWTFNQPVNITSGGLKIGGTDVINSSRRLINVTLSGLTVDGGTF
jgi:hypothetical protein